MQGVLIKFGLWLLQKVGAALLIVVIAVAGYGLWLFLQEEGALEVRRQERLAQLVAERDRLLTVQTAVEQRLAGIRTEVEQQREKVRQAEKIIATLRELESWWERWFGNREQQAANLERVQKMEAMKGDLAHQLAELQRVITQTLFERDGVDQALRRTNAEVAGLEASRSRVRHLVILAWEKTRWYVLGALAAYFFGPTLWALGMFYAVAPVLSRGRPIRLGPEPAALPEIGASRVSVEAALGPGETLRIKEKFLQASDEGIGRRTRFVLDWRIPFTSVACGLVELVELTNARSDGEFRITASNGEDPHLELAIVELPAGSSLVLRPRFLAGVIQRRDERLVIRRHWRVLHWQAWIGGQFRYFEFVGPCRLLVSGSRGVRAERLADRAGQVAPARRTNQDATIAFTPNLDYRPVRAETFWSYYRGMNPLFDDLFAGRGVFVLQETAAEGSAARAGRFWSGVWNGVLKVFGL
ncbi:MAG: hypothetical protein JNL92_08805 [Opitutaceae bacterium]|nr:hypothetical protein [Opitutaceae bacterium]